MIPANNKPALCYVIVMKWAATGSQVVRQLLHMGHYAAPPDNVTKQKIGVDLLVSFLCYGRHHEEGKDTSMATSMATLMIYHVMHYNTIQYNLC